MYENLELSPKTVLVELRYEESEFTLVSKEREPKPEKVQTFVAKVGSEVTRVKPGDRLLIVDAPQSTITRFELEGNDKSRYNTHKRLNSVVKDTKSNFSKQTNKIQVVDTAIIEENFIKLHIPS